MDYYARDSYHLIMASQETTTVTADKPTHVKIHHYLSIPVALASLLFVVVAFVEISNTGSVAVPWHRRFWRHGPPVILFWGTWIFLACEFIGTVAASPNKVSYLRRHWQDAAVAVLPFVGVIRLADAAIVVPLVQLLRGHGDHPQLAVLRKRKLGRLALTSALVVLLASVLEYVFEYEARGATITTYGEALWWAAATVTTVANQLYPVTTGGEVVGFLLMVYAVVVFAYLASSIASALIAGDAAQAQQTPSTQDQTGRKDQTAASNGPGISPGPLGLSQDELNVLRAILDRAGGAPPTG